MRSSFIAACPGGGRYFLEQPERNTLDNDADDDPGESDEDRYKVRILIDLYLDGLLRCDARRPVASGFLMGFQSLLSVASWWLELVGARSQKT